MALFLWSSNVDLNKKREKYPRSATKFSIIRTKISEDQYQNFRTKNQKNKLRIKINILGLKANHFLRIKNQNIFRKHFFRIKMLAEFLDCVFNCLKFKLISCNRSFRRISSQISLIMN